jgi:hypothetical protein
MSKAFPEPGRLAVRTLLLLLPVLLAACQGAPTASRQTLTLPAAAGRGGGAADAGPPAASAGLPSSADLASDPMRFKGLSTVDVTRLLGAPSYQRHDADAEIWQYYGPASACVLDLFVYVEGAEARVAHAELRSRNAGGTASACLAQIIDGRRG